MNHRLIAAAIAFYPALSVQAEDYASHNVVPDDLLTGIKRIEVKQTGALPAIHVKASSKGYEAVLPGQKISWQASSKGECRGARKIREFRWWLNDNSQSNPNAYYAWHKQLAKRDWITSKSKHNEYSAAGELETPVSAKLANAAKKACNDYLKAEQAKGKSLGQILAKAHVISPEQQAEAALAGVVFMQCNEDSGLNTMTGHAWQNIKIDYVCDAFDAPPSQQAGPASFDSPFVLEPPKVAVEPAKYSGACPVDLKVNGTLKASKGMQQVQYRWAHNGALGPVKTVMLNSSGWQSVNTVLKDVGKAAGPGQLKADHAPKGPGLQLKASDDDINGMVQLHVLAEGENNWQQARVSQPAPYSVNCRARLQGAGDVAAPRPGSVDLQPGPTLTIAQQTAPWGGTLVVDASEAGGRMRGERCELRFAYDVLNSAEQAAAQSASRLHEDQQTLHQAVVPGLAAGGKHRIVGHVYLANGSHVLGVSVDDKQQLVESDENNNRARIAVEVRGCGGEQGPRPAPRQPQ